VPDVFTCIRNHVRLETAGRLLAQNSERYLKPAATMEKLFADSAGSDRQTLPSSRRASSSRSKDLGYEFPKYPVPRGETMTSFLRKRTEEGARFRYTGTYGMPTYERARPQLERELTLIEKLKFGRLLPDRLGHREVCNKQRHPGQGRGSAANSAVCYSLGITAVDPVGMDLLFERFLSEERGEWPDIDLDLPSGDQRRRRFNTFTSATEKLGAAMTANVITYRGRSAAREGREGARLRRRNACTLSRHSSTRGNGKIRTITASDSFATAGLDLRQPRIKKFFKLYQLVAGPAAAPWPAFRRHGDLPGTAPTRSCRSSPPPCPDACGPMGQGRLRGPRTDQVDCSGLGMMSVLEESI
jgi:error-prone DNA polymerase